MRPDFIPERRRHGSDKTTTGKEEALETTDKKILKTCLVCKRTFLGWFSEKYCSADCQMEGNRLKARLRKRKSRKVGDLKEGVISQQLGELGLAETQYPMYNLEIVFQAEAGIRLFTVTGVQTCALPI